MADCVIFSLRLHMLLFIASDLILKLLVLGDTLRGQPSQIGFGLLRAVVCRGRFGRLLFETSLPDIAILVDSRAMGFDATPLFLQLFVVGLKAWPAVAGVRLCLLLLCLKLFNGIRTL